MRVSKQLFFAILLPFPLLNAQTVSPITADDLSRIFEYPGKITASDKTQELLKKHGNSVISAILFEPDDYGFSRIQVLTTEGGFLLNQARRQKFDSADHSIQKIELPAGISGYTGLEGFGTGGESYIAVAHLPEQNLDVQFKVIISNDGASQGPANAENYHRILRNEQALHEALNAMLTHGVEFLVAAGSIERPLIEPSPPPVLKMVESNEEVQTGEATKSSGESADSFQVENQKPNLLWLLGIGVAFSLMLIRLFIKKKS